MDHLPVLWLLLPTIGLPLFVGLIARSGIIGPLFAYDLLRLTRNGSQVRLRVLFAGLLLLALFFLYVDWFRNVPLSTLMFDLDANFSIEQMATFARSFVVLFMMMQLIAVYLMMPVFAAMAISSERERRTLDLLLTTHLSDREIVLGPYVARMVHIAGILLTGLPILALTQLWGGVDFESVLSAYGITLATMVSTGGLALMIGSFSRDLQQTLLRTYAVLLMFEFLAFCPCGFLLLEGVYLSSLMAVGTNFGSEVSSPSPQAMLQLIGFHSLLGAVMVTVAIRRLRGPRPREQRPTVGSVLVPELLPSSLEPIPIPFPHWYFRDRPRIDDEEPLLWKEQHVRGLPIPERPDRWFTGFESLFLAMALFLLVILAVFTIGGLMFGQSITGMYLTVFQVFGGLLVMGWLGTMGLHAVTTLTREREKGTLLSLFTLPVDSEDILWAKAEGSWSRGRKFLWFLVGVAFAGLVTGGLHFVSLMLVAAALIVMGLFAIVAAMWFSQCCRTTMVATAWYLFAGLVLTILPVLIGIFVRSFDPGAYLIQVCYSFSPPILWLRLIYSTDATIFNESAFQRALTGMIAVGGYMMVTVLLWWDIGRRFERERRGEGVS